MGWRGRRNILWAVVEPLVAEPAYEVGSPCRAEMHIENIVQPGQAGADVFSRKTGERRWFQAAWLKVVQREGRY